MSDPIDVRDLPLRSSFISKAVSKCWRLAKLEAENPVSKKPHYFLGGQVFALMCDQYFSSGFGAATVEEAAAYCFIQAVKTEAYEFSVRQKETILQRCAEGFHGLIDWCENYVDMTVLGSEIEVRSVTSGGRDIAIKIDLLCIIDEKIYLLDVKTFGMWSSSITASVVSREQLRQSVQLSMYSYFLERGGQMYTGHVSRTETNAEVAARLPARSGKIRPDKVGYINIAMLTRRRRTTAKGNAGEYRGDPLTVINYDPSMAEYAVEQVNTVELMMTFNQWPRTTRYERGRSSCSGCQFNSDCWSGRVAPGVPPSWLAKTERK